jgi:hypothetical protein
MEENKKGGKRIGSGRKPLTVGSKKVQVTLYVAASDIWKFGNDKKMKDELYKFIGEYENEKLKIKHVTPLPEKQLISEYNATHPNQFTSVEYVSEKTFQQHINEIAELDTEYEYKNKADEIESSSLPRKQKDLLLLNMKTAKL